MKGLPIIAALGLGCVPLGAQDNPPTQFEVTPFIGMRLGGDVKLNDSSRKLDVDDAGTFALAFNLRIDDVSQYELFFGHQSTSLERDPLLGKLDIDIDYLHIGGTVEAPMENQSESSLISWVDVGATRFNPDAAEASDKTKFSLSLGGGVKVPFNDRFAAAARGARIPDVRRHGYVVLLPLR